jgi:hypothetical protein
LIDLLNENGTDVTSEELAATEVLVNGLLIKPNGEMWAIDIRTTEDDNPTISGEMLQLTGPYYALGHGREAALGAMFCGANASRAIEAACGHAPYLALPVQTLKLKRARA